MSEHEQNDADARKIAESFDAFFTAHGPQAGMNLMAQMVAIMAKGWSSQPPRTIEAIASEAQRVLALIPDAPETKQ